MTNPSNISNSPPAKTDTELTGLRILILEDAPIDAELMEEVLRMDRLAFTSRRVDTRDAFIRALEEFKPDIILSDYHLPEFDGLTALKIVRQTHPEMPVIMVTGALDDIEAVEFIHAGAKDYMLKDRLARLASAVRRVLSGELGIRARKAAEQALRESENLYRSLFENMLNGFAYCQMIFEQGQPQDFIYLSVNAAFEKLTGLKNVAGKRVSEVIPGIRQSDPGLFDTYGRISLSGKSERFEMYVQALQQWFWISVYSPGKGYFVAIFDVITERKLAEQALLQSEAELKALVEHSPIAMLVDVGVEADEKIVMMNQKFTELFGYTLEDVPDVRHWWPLAYPDERYREEIRTEWIRRVEKAIQNHIDIEPMEATIACKDASKRYVKVSLASIGSRNIITFEDLTERKKAEGKLLESETRFRVVADSALALVWMAGPDKLCTWFNKIWLEFTGRTTEQEIGNGWTEGVHPDDLQRCLDVYVSRFDRRETFHMEYRLKRHDGEYRWIYDSGTPHFDEKGNFLGYIGSCFDITERKQMEDALKEAADRNQAIMETANDAIICMKPDGAVHLWNHKAEEMFGYTGAEAIGRDLHELIVPERFRAKAMEGMRQFARTGTGPLVGKMQELAAWHRDKTEFPVELSISPMNIHGEWHATGIIRDITGRKAQEAKIKRLNELLLILREINEYLLVVESEQKLFQAVCNSLNKLGDIVIAWVVLKEPQSKIMPVSWAGIAESELAALRVKWDDAERGIGFIGSAIKERKPVVIQDVEADAQLAAWQEVIRKWGIKSATAIPIHVNDEVIATLSVFSHKRGAFDDELLKFLYEVVGDVAVGVQTLRMNKELGQAHGLLLQSEKMASIGQLAAGVAHEINNPVGYVNSNLGTLGKYMADIFNLIDKYEQTEMLMDCHEQEVGELRQFKKNIDLDFLRQDAVSLLAESRQGLERVKNIILDLKGFSRINANEEWMWADIHQGLESTLSVVWNELKYKCAVKKEYGTLPQIYCLPSQLNQVFMNLLVNAAQAIEVRGEITIRTGHKDNKVWVEIADTGKGIPAEHMPQLFDPFFTTKPVGQGTGLGLSVSYSIVEKHHGRIEVKSEVGKGSVFRVWLPVEQPT